MAHTHAMEIGVSVSFTSASVDAVVRVICPMIMPLLAESNTSFDPTTPSTLLRVGLVDQATLSLTSEHVIADVTTFRDGATKIFRVDHFTQEAARSTAALDQFLIDIRTQARSYPHHPAGYDIPELNRAS